MLRYLHRRTAQPKRRRPRHAADLNHHVSHGTANEGPPVPGSSGPQSELDSKFETVMTKPSEAVPVIYSELMDHFFQDLGEAERPESTPHCKVCMDLDANALPFFINMTHLGDLLSSQCPACLMLHTVLQRWAEDVNDTGMLYLYLSSMDPGLRVNLVARPKVDEYIVLQSAVGFPSPWPSIPERYITPAMDGLDLAARQILQWLETCESSHACSQAVSPTPLPRRVIEILAPDKVRLRVTRRSESGRYTCLSHCWGGVVPLQLTSASSTLFQNDIPWGDLPTTFKHAIELTEKLGIRYVWIDSLCILQDDLVDWQLESSKMAAIYSNATLTIAATASSDSTGGLCRIQDSNENVGSSQQPTMHSFVNTDGSIFKILAGPDKYTAFVSARQLPLQKRAWFFQEWILSPRIVHFTDSMLNWECSEIQQLNDGTVLTSIRHGGGGKKNTLASLTRPPPAAFTAAGEKSYQAMAWHALVRIYSGLQLTYPADIFPALQGIATRIAAVSQCSFYAGLWEDSLVLDLLWRLRSPCTMLEDRAPTWSWASRSGEIVWQTWRWNYAQPTKLLPDVSIVSIATKTTGENTFGQVLGGQLVLRGLCLPAAFGPETDHSGPILRVKLSRMNSTEDLMSLEDTHRWTPDNNHDPSPDADVLIMLIGLWPIRKNKSLVHES